MTQTVSSSLSAGAVLALSWRAGSRRQQQKVASMPKASFPQTPGARPAALSTALKPPLLEIRHLACSPCQVARATRPMAALARDVHCEESSIFVSLLPVCRKLVPRCAGLADRRPFPRLSRIVVSTASFLRSFHTAVVHMGVISALASAILSVATHPRG